MYGGGRELDDFIAFINDKCGTSRDEGGQLTPEVSNFDTGVRRIIKKKVDAFGILLIRLMFPYRLV